MLRPKDKVWSEDKSRAHPRLVKKVVPVKTIHLFAVNGSVRFPLILITVFGLVRYYEWTTW